jgi:serine/threonine protein kinase
VSVCVYCTQVRENEELVLVFEFCEGSLHQAIVGQKAKGHDFSEAQVRGCVLQLLTALDYIHRKGYFHRDIKPENVLLNSEGESPPRSLIPLGGRQLASIVSYRGVMCASR